MAGVLELFERAGASNELLEFWKCLESRNTQGLSQGTPLPQGVREYAVRHIMRLADIAKCSRQSQNLCVTLFDAVCARAQRVPVEELASTCAAIVYIVRKEEDAKPFDASEKILELASSFATSLGSSVSHCDILSQEHEVLKVLGWIVRIPTIDSWLTVMCKRLSVLTRNRFAHLMQAMQTHLQHAMQVLLLKQPATSDLTSGSTACGILCLTLVQARMLPASILKCDDVDEVSWQRLLSGCQLPGQRALAAALSPEQGMALLRSLMIATCRDLASMRVDCMKVARTLSQALAEIMHHRRQ